MELSNEQFFFNLNVQGLALVPQVSATESCRGDYGFWKSRDLTPG